MQMFGLGLLLSTIE